MHYELRLSTTSAGTGYFACQPAQDQGLDAFLGYLRAHPNDKFMHKRLLEMVSEVDEALMARLIELAKPSDPDFLAILYEACLSRERFAGLRARFDASETKRLSERTPLIIIKSSLLGDQYLHAVWAKLFGANISDHQPLSAGGEGLPPHIFSEDDLRDALRRFVHIRDVAKTPKDDRQGSASSMVPVEETAARALTKLEEAKVFAGPETVHASSLSPHGFLRKWNLSLSVQNGRHRYSLSGIQTSYGKGISEPVARASYSMEVVERCSSFAGFDESGAVGFVKSYPLVHGRYSELAAGDAAVLNPAALNLEAPYEDEPLYWLQGERRTGALVEPVLVPVQCIFLFCNLDEVDLFSGLGSTGLASGNTVEEARLSGLLEVIERDSEAVTLYDPARCFTLEADDPDIAALLADYRAKGVHVQFQDISADMGVPCYKCFVIDPRGGIVKGTAAHLNGRRALLSAMLETTYPYPAGPPSGPPLEGLPAVRYEDLPDYSTGDAAKDLALLEAVLDANRFQPVYVDLTRKDLQLPVAKSLIPGLELMADFDRFSRISPRLFANYLRLPGPGDGRSGDSRADRGTGTFPGSEG